MSNDDERTGGAGEDQEPRPSAGYSDWYLEREHRTGEDSDTSAIHSEATSRFPAPPAGAPGAAGHSPLPSQEDGDPSYPYATGPGQESAPYGGPPPVHGPPYGPSQPGYGPGYGGAQPYGQQPAAGPGQGQPYPGYQGPGYQGPGYPGPGPYPPGYGPGPYAPGNPEASAANSQGIILLVVSLVSAVLLSCLLIGIPSAVMGGVAMSRSSQDPAGARRLVRNGWIVFGVNAGVVILGVIVLVAVLAASGV